MKTIWSVEGVDPGRMVHRFKAGRQILQKDSAGASDNLYIISFGRADQSNEYWLTSMADGMQILKSQTLEELAAKMSEGDYHPMSRADKASIISHAVDVATSIR